MVRLKGKQPGASYDFAGELPGVAELLEGMAKRLEAAQALALRAVHRAYSLGTKDGLEIAREETSDRRGKMPPRRTR